MGNTRIPYRVLAVRSNKERKSERRKEMQKQKGLAVLFAMMAAVSLAACGSGTSGTTQSAGDKVESGATEASLTASAETSGEDTAQAKQTWDTISRVTLYYPVYFNMPSDAGIAAVEQDLNKYLETNYGVDIELHPLDMFQYTDQINLVLSSGDQVDIFMPMAGLSTYVSKGQILPMDEYQDELQPAMDLMGEDFMKSSYLNGKLYSLPVYKANTYQWYFICRKDLAEETGFDLSSVKSIADLEPLLQAVHDKHPDIYPLCPTNPNDFQLVASADGPEFDIDIDYLGDNPDSCTGAVIGESDKVENFYTSDAFRAMINRAYDWNQKGLLMPEASVSPDIASDLIASGRGFGSIIGYGYPIDPDNVNMGNRYGNYDMTFATCGTDLMQSAAFNNQYSIGYTSADPRAAARLMNALWTDEKVTNEIIYGVEGEDYIIQDGFDPANDMPEYPDGLDETTVPYQARVSCGCFANNFLMYGFQGKVKDFGMDLINHSKRSKYLGFLYDSSNCKTEVTACNNVIKQYYIGLECGEMDPNETLPKFEQELKAAGIDTIIADKQSQLDAWLSAQK